MQRIAKILAALCCAAGIFAADAAWAHGPGGWGGGWHGGWGGGWGWGGWGYPYGYWPYDYGYGYPYGYDYPPPAPAISPYCATRTRICTLRQPRAVGSTCTCRGVRGVISAGPPPR
jgi:hypothetical protein